MAFRLYLNTFFRTSSHHPVVASFFASAYSLLLLFAFHLLRAPSAISYHYSRTGYEDKTAMRRLLFCLLSMF